MTSNLLKATLLLLDQTSKEEWVQIAKDIDVTYTWLVKLENENIKEPGVNKIERLYNRLSGKILEV